MKYILLPFLLLVTFLGISQTAVIEGLVIRDNNLPVNGAVVSLDPGGLSTLTDSKGYFKFSNLQAGSYTLQYSNNSADVLTLSLTNGQSLHIGRLVISSIVDKELAANIFSDLDVLETTDETSSVSSLLTASDDVFLNKAGYQFGSDVFFNVRGYDSQYADFMINGVRFENPETGWQPYSLVGGLNDVLRYRDQQTVGADKLEEGFGEIGGGVNFNLRPSLTGKGGRITYSRLNRYYNNRVMGTYSSGDRKGLSYVVSGSHRWAQEGYVDGTYYDAYGAYAAVEGKVTDNYSVMASAFAAPRRRGTQSIHVQQAYDLFGSNYYNADWGWQNGEKRNARLRKNYTPVLMFSNYLNIGNNTSLQLTGSYLFGTNVSTRIERQNAGSADPDYYSEFENGTFLIEPQIDWVGIYRANLDGTDDNDLYSGIRANYILEDNVRDDKDYQVVLNGHTTMSNILQLDYGANFRHYQGNYFKRINDLLGADYWLNIDAFNGNVNNFEGETDTRKYQHDKFGNDYNLNKRNYDAYLQGQFTLDKFDLFFSGTVGHTEFWREGNVATGSFPNESLGKGETKDFVTYGGKAGATYKLDGRNYFSLNGMYYTKPPLMNVMYVSASSRDGFNPLTKEQLVYGGEVNYKHNSPTLKLRATGYVTRFEEQANAILTFFDAGTESGFGTFFTNGIDKLHVGGELGFNYKVNPEIAVSGAASVGKYTIMSRPLVSAYEESTPNPIFAPSSSFLLDFYEDNTPQTALNLGLTYRAPWRMIFNIDGNYYDDSFASPSALRRTLNVASQLTSVEGLTDEESLSYWTKQERLPEAFRLNLSLYKEIRFSYDKQIGINASVSNLLDDEDYPNLAFEQLRVASYNGRINPDDFPTRYRYAPGRTYFINIAYKFR